MGLSVKDVEGGSAVWSDAEESSADGAMLKVAVRKAKLQNAMLEDAMLVEARWCGGCSAARNQCWRGDVAGGSV